MDYYIKINNKEVKLKNIQDFSISEYNNLFEILNFKFNNINEQYKLLLELFSDLEESEIENIKDIYKINFSEILKQEIKSKKINLKFGDYNLINLNNITIGRFIDLEYFLNKFSDDKRLEKITSLLYLKDSENENIENDFNDLVIMINSKMKIGNILQVIELFTSFRNEFYNKYHNLFNLKDSDDSDDDDDSDDSDDDDGDVIINIDDSENNLLDSDDSDDSDDSSDINNIGLLEFIYILSGDDYLKVEKLLNSNLYSIMNYLSWLKERNDKVKNKRK